MSHPSRAFLVLAAAVLPFACAEPLPIAAAEPAEEAAVAAPAAALWSVADSGCPKQSGSKTGAIWRQGCTGTKEGPCDKYDPIKSNRCLAEANRMAGVTVDYSFFGKVDCRTSSRGGTKITKVVVHNGDSAEKNNENWHCRKGAAHYTVDRDGKIYQHVGEELQSWHASSTPVNEASIGIELQIRRKYGTTCNSIDDARAREVAKDYGIHVDDVMTQLCAPTREQYASLAKLVKDIESRYAIAEVFGHCEVKGTTHGDPRAFDWSELGQSQRAEVGQCAWYDVRGVAGNVIAVSKIDADRTRITVSGGKLQGVEVGDHGWLTDAAEREVAGRWFEVEKVNDKSSIAVVGMGKDEVMALGRSMIVARPGKTPPPLTAANKGSKPALGSCEKEYGYHKGGKIEGFITGNDGSVTMLIFSGLGWADGVCDDATGMIYLGDASDRYVTDDAGTKIRFRMSSVDRRGSNAKVIEGTLTTKMLEGNERVVVRKAK